MRHLLLGVDGGATKTVALIAEPDGTIVGFARSGSSDVHADHDPEQPIGRVAAAVRDAARIAEVDTGELGTSVFSLCGADWPEDIDLYTSRLTVLLRLGSGPMVMNDAMGALRSGSRDGVGVALTLGTGGAIGARGPDGSSWFSGMRLERTGALEFGQHALTMLIRAEYGEGPMPGFGPAALSAFGVGSVDELLHAVTARGGMGDKGLGRLAVVLLEASHLEDPDATAYIHEHGRILASYVRSAAQRVGLPDGDNTLVVSGGLLRHHCTNLLDSVMENLEGFSLVRPAVEPAFGALLWAADRAGVSLDLERMRATGPDAVTFRTL